jgi:hypothetical protein
MTARALIVGFLVALFIAGMGYINDRMLELESFNNGHQIPIIVLGMMVLAVAVGIPLFFRLRASWAFRPPEVALVVILAMAACSIPGRGLMEHFVHILVMPFHWDRLTPGWTDTEGDYRLLDYAPGGTLVEVDDHEKVVMRFIRGRAVGAKAEAAEDTPWYGAAWGWVRDKVAQVPWRQWWRPLFFWLPLFLLSGVCMVSMALIVHRQWAHHELLSYPIADFTSSLIERETDRAFGPLLRNRIFWLGFALVFFFRVNNGLQCWFPDVLIPIPHVFSLRPLTELCPSVLQVYGWWGLVYVNVFPLVIAFCFFLSSEISLTLGLSQLVWVLAAIPMMSAGIVLSTDYDIGGWIGWNRAGSYTALPLMLLYGGRHYYGGLLARALVFWRGQSDADRAVWAMRIFLVSSFALVVSVWSLGLDWPIAAALVFLVLVTFLVVSRISAETGLFFIQPGWQPFGALMAFMGGYAIGPAGIVISGLVCAVLCIDQSQALMPYLVNGLKIGESVKLKPARTGGVTFLMYVLGVAVAVPIVLCASYQEGATTYFWGYHRIPTMAFRAAQTEVLQLKAQGQLRQSEQLGWLERLRSIKPKKQFLWAAGSGFVLVLIFAMLRLRLTWWPLHPVLFLVWGTYPLAVLSASFFIGWFAKKMVVRFGGDRLLKRIRPMMIGVIAGEICGALVFMIAGAVYYFVTGDKPVSYRFFPR